MPIIAISGKHGSGKTTAAKKLAEILGYKYVSAGVVFREMARERGYSLKEFSNLAEKDSSIDRQIDEQTVAIAKQFDNIVVDAQLAGWLLRDFANLSVCISATFENRVKRIAQRENRSLDDVHSETLLRERSEGARYAALYSYDIDDLGIYDLIINTDRINANTVVEILLAAVKELEKNQR
ncbi:MAG: (d)CMP kinase [Candidatus Heimdallarchaeaceae archaeon]